MPTTPDAASDAESFDEFDELVALSSPMAFVRRVLDDPAELSGLTPVALMDWYHELAVNTDHIEDPTDEEAVDAVLAMIQGVIDAQ